MSRWEYSSSLFHRGWYIDRPGRSTQKVAMAPGWQHLASYSA